MAKRTTAQRRKAAKEAWARRRAAAADGSVIDMAVKTEQPAPPVTVQYIKEPQIAYAVREGADIFVCFARDGSINRQRLEESTARKLLRDLTALLV